MSIASSIREQLLKSFRAELAEHIQSMTDGLLALEQGRADTSLLDTSFRAAHSLKGAARAMGVTAIEQLAHGLESVMDGLRHNKLPCTPELFTTCYSTLDTIQAVQAAYEAGETTPPMQALLAMGELEKIRLSMSGEGQKPAPFSEPPAQEPKPEDQPAAQPPAPNNGADRPVPEAAAPQAAAQKAAAPVKPAPEPAAQPAAATPTPANGGGNHTPAPAVMDETVRVNVGKLDSLMGFLSELVVARIRLEQRQSQLQQLQQAINELQHDWNPVRGPFNRLLRQQENGLLSLHRPRSVDVFPHSGGPQGGAQNNNKSLPFSGLLRGGTLAAVEESDDLNRFKSLVELSKDAAPVLRYVNESQEQLHQINAKVGELARQYAADTMNLSMVIEDLEEEIKRLRMMPFSTITATFARMVRDLAVQAGKEATLTIFGSEVEVDRRILEGIKDPLTHLLRNALDHGIEKPEKRAAAGKPRTGQITLSAEQVGKDILIRLSDDGEGLDMDAIRQAVSRQSGGRQGGGYGTDPNTEAMSDSELIDALFRQGVSTSRIITDVSGRGIGLNVVRNNIENLHGRIEVESQPGEGTTFLLTMPLTMTGSRGLLVRSGGQLFAIPIQNVERTLAIQPSDIFTLEGSDTIQYENRPVTLLRLSEVLDLPEDKSSEAALNQKRRMPVVLLTSAEKHMALHQSRLMAFIVDELAGEQEVVIKGLGKQLIRVVGLSGVTVMGNGEVVPILSAGDLMRLATRRSGRSVLDDLNSQPDPKEVLKQKRILVVDDSITTRTLEKNILEAAGYSVLIATDGYEALGLVRSGERPDLVVTDIVMPRMDGFDLCRQIKQDPQLSTLPVILVTSLDSQADKERGIEVQADAYIVKSSFDQVNLLETIEQLI